MHLITLDTGLITDWGTFHDVFAKTFGFPDFYGRSMDAWIDCMTCLDDPAAGMSNVHADPGCIVVLHLQGVDGFSCRCPEQYVALLECAAFVNWRRIERGEPAILALSFDKQS